MSKAQHPNDTGTPAYERQDVNIRRILGAGVALLLIAVGALLAMWWVFRELSDRESREEPVPSIFMSQREPPPEPRLQVDEPLDLKNIRASEDTLLKSYGWVDEKAGIVRIPLDRALQLAATRGLPTWPVTAENALIEGSQKNRGIATPKSDRRQESQSEKPSERRTP